MTEDIEMILPKIVFDKFKITADEVEYCSMARDYYLKGTVSVRDHITDELLFELPPMDKQMHDVYGVKCAILAYLIGHEEGRCDGLEEGMDCMKRKFQQFVSAFSMEDNND